VKDHKATVKEPFWQGFRLLIRQRSFAVRLIGASLAWFLMDFAYYGNTVSSPLVLSAIAPHKDLMTHTLMQLAVFTLAAAPAISSPRR
jgi:MFS transporter, PHS family, inorganic phosphate transporter